MSVRVFGVSMHCYRVAGNSDKFYRAFTWTDTDGQHYITRCWGRDGTIGQFKTTPCYDGQAELDSIRNQQLSPAKGYQLLGAGSLNVDEEDVRRNPRDVGKRLHEWVGRPPLKLPDDYVFVIREEDDILDLITAV